MADAGPITAILVLRLAVACVLAVGGMTRSADALPAEAMAPTRLRGEVGRRATRVRQLLTLGRIASPGVMAEDPPVELQLPVPPRITVPPAATAAILGVLVTHGVLANAAAASSLSDRFCAGTSTSAERLGCWLDTLVWAQHTFVDGAALGARSQPPPPHLTRPTKKQRRATARDDLRRHFRAVRQVVELATHPNDVAKRVASWLVQAGPGAWSAYTELVEGLARYRALTARPLPSMPADTPVSEKLAWRKRRLRRKWERKINDTHRQALRARLCFEGYCPLPRGKLRPTTRHRSKRKLRGFQSDLVEQLRAWQRHRGLRDHGMLDLPTLKALAVPMTRHVTKIRLALQRMRDTGAGAEEHLFIANIPAFQLIVWRSGKRERSHRTQVGKGVRRRGGKWVPGLRTPLISARLRFLVLNPEWVVPTSIRREYRWKIKRDPDYLIKHGFEMRGSTMVMKSGPGNLLGRVKFLFTNPHLVYLHDTPSQWAFHRTRRTLSHGCVRVQHAEELARYLLTHERGRRYTTRSWDEYMKRVTNKWKYLRKPIAIHVVYWTAEVTRRGAVRFLPDVYGYDEADLTQWQAADTARLSGL